MRQLTEVERAFLAGLLVGEGSFTGDYVTPHCDLRMSMRHEHLMRLVHSWQPFTRLYGPYVHDGRNYMIVRWRGPALRSLIKELEDFGLEQYCPHVNRRMQRIKARLDFI